MVNMKTVEYLLRESSDVDLEHIIKTARDLLQFRKRLRKDAEKSETKLRGIKTGEREGL